MYHSVTQAINDVSIANLFSSYSGSIYSTLDLDDIPLVNCDMRLESLEITRQDIFIAVGDLDNNVNLGRDGNPAYFVKNCMPSLQSPILRIYESLEYSLPPGSTPLPFPYISRVINITSLITGRYPSCPPWRSCWAE